MTSPGRPLTEPSRLTAAVFLLLVGATAAAFFAAQRLKHQPPLLRQKGGDRAFSPNGDGIKDAARIRFTLPKPDDVTVTILDDDGGTVARVASNVALPSKRVVTLRWDGRGDDGRVVPEGTYHVRVGLRKQGRTNTLAHTVEVDLTPPRPRIAAVRGPSHGPFVIDGQLRRTATVRLDGPGRKPRFAVWRTDGARPRLVVPRLRAARGARRARWNGAVRSRPAPPGTYLISLQARDRAGNVGSAPPHLPPPRAGRARGGVGVTVRPLAVTAPLGPVSAGRRTHLTVDAGGRRYRWSLRPIGPGRGAQGSSAAHRLAVRIPPGREGAYVVTVGSHGQRARTVVPVAGDRRRHVLVVLPQLTWQGRNDVDDDGDGLPDSLARDRTAGLVRPFAHGRLPRGFGAAEGPLLAFLGRNRLRYQLTTDLALARAADNPFAGYDGVVLAGDARWLPRVLGLQLKTFVLNGGRVLSLGVDSLRRTAEVRQGRLRAASEPAPVDLLRARIGPLRQGPIDLLVQSDGLRLFSGTAGALGAFDAWEPTSSVAPGRLVAVAGETGGDPVFVAYRLARGLVIRPGVRGWGAALADDIGPNAETMRRIWTLLG